MPLKITLKRLFLVPGDHIAWTVPNSVYKPSFTTSDLQFILHPQLTQAEAEENQNGHLERWANNDPAAKTITKAHEKHAKIAGNKFDNKNLNYF